MQTVEFLTIAAVFLIARADWKKIINEPVGDLKW